MQSVYLRVLDLSSNFFTSHIPPEVASLLYNIYLDLSGRLCACCLRLAHLMPSDLM